jgi:hypothetical protein
MIIYPYVYKCTHKFTSEFYFGYRKANKVPAELDLGIVYRTSSKIVKSNFDNYHYEIIAIFYSSADAHMFEQSLIKESWDNPLLLNKAVNGYAPTNKNLVVVKDRHNVRFRVSVNDPRYILGELVYYQKGVPISEDHKRNISNSQKGHVTIRNCITGECKRVHHNNNLLNSAEWVAVNLGSKRTKSTKQLQSESAKIACLTRHMTYVSRLEDKKTMSLGAFNQWINGTVSVMPPKLLCCRIADRKIITVNYLNRVS